MPSDGMPKGYGLPGGARSPSCREVQGQRPHDGRLRSRGDMWGHQHLANRQGNGLSKLAVSSSTAFGIRNTNNHPLTSVGPSPPSAFFLRQARHGRRKIAILSKNLLSPSINSPRQEKLTNKTNLMKALSTFFPSLNLLDSVAFFRRPVRGLMALMLHCRPRPKVEDGGIVAALGWFHVWFRVVNLQVR